MAGAQNMRVRHATVPMAATAAVLALALAGCTGSGGGPPATRSASPTPSTRLSITSSITPGAVLTEPFTWHADVAGASGPDVQHVDFLIDGDVRWREQSAPYEFDEGGLLAPWPLGAGRHELIARAVAADGSMVETAAKVVVKDVPHTLPTGTYRRTVTDADYRRVQGYRDPAHGGSGDLPASGPWVLHVRPDGVLTLDVVPATQYDAFYEPYRTDGQRLTVSGPAFWLQPHPDQGSIFCDPELPGSYTWSYKSGTLTVDPVGKVCPDRDTVLAGAWRRD